MHVSSTACHWFHPISPSSPQAQSQGHALLGFLFPDPTGKQYMLHDEWTNGFKVVLMLFKCLKRSFSKKLAKTINIPSWLSNDITIKFPRRVQADLLYISVKKKKRPGERGSDIALRHASTASSLSPTDCILAGRQARLNYATPLIQTQTFHSEEILLFYRMINLYKR